MIDRITDILIYILLLPVILAVAAGCLVVAGVYMLVLAGFAVVDLYKELFNFYDDVI